MICLTRLDGKELWVNSDLILTVEATPDTMLLLQGGLHLMVREPPEEVIDRIVAYRHRVLAGPERPAPERPSPERHGALVALPRPPEE